MNMKIGTIALGLIMVFSFVSAANPYLMHNIVVFVTGASDHDESFNNELGKTGENMTIHLNNTVSEPVEEIGELMADGSRLVARDSYTNTYKMPDGTYRSQIFSRHVNMKDENGNYKPYEEVTTFIETEDSLYLAWHDKSVHLKFKGIEKNTGNLIDVKETRDMKTTIKEHKGYYYFDHLLDGSDLEEFYYDIEADGVGCVFERYALICGEQVIDFSEAVYEQNLLVVYDEGLEKRIRITGDNLSYIDPLVSIAANEYGRLKFDSTDPSDPYSIIYTYGNIGTNNQVRSTGFGLFPLNFSRAVDVSDIIFQSYFDGIVDDDCTTTYLDIFEMDENTTNFYPSSQEELEVLYLSTDNGTNYARIGGLTYSNRNQWKSADLGGDADRKFEEISYTQNRFALGFAGEFPVEDNKDCETHFKDYSINVTYELVETIPPVTTATADVVPFNTTYTFGSVTPYNVRVNLSCYDANSSCAEDSPKYCVDTTDTCTPTTNGTSVVISDEGVSYIRYFSEDIKRNVEDISSKVINISRDDDSLQLRVGGSSVWNTSENFFEVETIEDLADDINTYLETCVADAEGYCTVPINLSSSIDKSVTLSDIKVNYGVSHYLWNISELTSGSDYMIRIFGIGRYINTSGTSGIFSIDSSLDATDFSVVYENNAERVFKFKVRNTADETLNNVAWKIETGESTINSNSSMDMTLESGEEAFVFVFHNYTTYGDFIVNATVFNAEFSDITPNINVTIPDPTPFPTDGLVHYYKLDATSGDVVDELDSENLTNNGATRGVTGKIENAFSFDGSNDYVNNSQEIDLGNNYSIFAWVKIDTIAGNSKYIVGNGNKAGTNYMSISYWIENDGNIWWQGDLSSQQDMYLYWDADIVANDSWYHVGIVKRDKKRVEAYVNGQNLTNVLFERTDNWGGDTDYDNDGDFSIGAYTSNGAKTGNFDGSIDEVGVWNRSFNLTEISNLYNDGDGLSY